MATLIILDHLRAEPMRSALTRVVDQHTAEGRDVLLQLLLERRDFSLRGLELALDHRVALLHGGRNLPAKLLEAALERGEVRGLVEVDASEFLHRDTISWA